MSEWSVVYEKAIRDDGSYLFPERLTPQFLESARRTLGSYFYANQYQNEVIPNDEKRFKKEWIRYFTAIPADTFRYGFIDPAIGQKDHHDFTAIVVVDTDKTGQWYVRAANRYRLTPTEIVNKMFEVCDEFKLRSLGVEVVAFQEALIYMLGEEMKRRQRVIPVHGVTRASVSKETRILGLVPRFEWNRILLAQGLIDLENELASFPRSKHDDLLDALASIDEVAIYPKEGNANGRPWHSGSEYEKWYIQQLEKGKSGRFRDPGSRDY